MCWEKKNNHHCPQAFSKIRSDLKGTERSKPIIIPILQKGKNDIWKSKCLLWQISFFEYSIFSHWASALQAYLKWHYVGVLKNVVSLKWLSQVLYPCIGIFWTWCISPSWDSEWEQMVALCGLDHKGREGKSCRLGCLGHLISWRLKSLPWTEHKPTAKNTPLNRQAVLPLVAWLPGLNYRSYTMHENNPASMEKIKVKEAHFRPSGEWHTACLEDAGDLCSFQSIKCTSFHRQLGTSGASKIQNQHGRLYIRWGETVSVICIALLRVLIFKRKERLNTNRI